MSHPILLIDTSLQGVSVGIATLGSRTSYGTISFCRQHLDNMGSMIAISRLVEDGLKETGLTMAGLAGVGVGVGPGSFTGIKVGLAFAYAVRTALGGRLPVLGISALEEAAERLREDRKVETLLLFLPATRTHGFAGIATKGGGTRALLVEAESEPSMVAALGAAAEPHTEIMGVWPAMEAALSARRLRPEPVTASEVCAQAIYGMADKAAAEWPHGFEGLTDIPGPRYLRLSTAEEKLAAEGRL